MSISLFVFLHLFPPPPPPFLYLSTHALSRACALNSTSKTVYHTWIRLIRLFITPTPPAAVVQWILSVFNASTAPSSAFSAKEKSPLLSFFFIFFLFLLSFLFLPKSISTENVFSFLNNSFIDVLPCKLSRTGEEGVGEWCGVCGGGGVPGPNLCLHL